MSVRVCLCADTIGFPDGGGHAWAYLNWALGLKSIGCEVTWLETVSSRVSPERLGTLFSALQRNLTPFGFQDRIAIFRPDDGSPATLSGAIDFEEATRADVLVNLKYGLHETVVGQFRRTALIDIDPGLLQIWLTAGQVRIAPHDLYFTTGETVGTAEARFPDASLRWHYTPPCVALDWWPVSTVTPDASFRTVSSWWGGGKDEGWVEENGEWYRNDKRTAFLPFLQLPRRTSERLELALYLPDDDDSRRDKEDLERCGWTIHDSRELCGSPLAYRSYLQGAKGEFSCAKPSCRRLQNAWVSDRTLCFLASGKPAVVEHTGPSRFLPDASGLLRFQDMESAQRLLETVAADYDHQCREARYLAEEYFAARKVAGRLLETALTA